MFRDRMLYFSQCFLLLNETLCSNPEYVFVSGFYCALLTCQFTQHLNQSLLGDGVCSGPDRWNISKRSNLATSGDVSSP